MGAVRREGLLVVFLGRVPPWGVASQPARLVYTLCVTALRLRYAVGVSAAPRTCMHAHALYPYVVVFALHAQDILANRDRGEEPLGKGWVWWWDGFCSDSCLHIICFWHNVTRHAPEVGVPSRVCLVCLIDLSSYPLCFCREYYYTLARYVRDLSSDCFFLAGA